MSFQNENKQIIEKVAKEFNLPKKVILFAYLSVWNYIREEIENMNPEEITDENFNDVKRNFNIKRFLKLYTRPELIKSMNYIKTTWKK
jgi:hypothetical protein